MESLTKRAQAQGKTPLELIEAALGTHGSVTAAAKALHVSRPTILWHLEKHGLRAVTTMKPAVKLVPAETN